MRVVDHLKEYRFKRKIFKYYKNTKDEEILENIKYLKNKRVTFFNYEWFTPQKIEINVMFDNEEKRSYVLYNGHRMYFKKEMNEKQIKDYCSFLFCEQDARSPHFYMDESIRKTNKKRVVIDAGTAEGSFALSVIDECEKIYLIECDEKWIEALKVTFKNYKEKVVIIKGYLSDNNCENNITLDSLLKTEKNVDLIKMDIEGYELKALQGANRILQDNEELVMLICAYHYQAEEKELRAFLNGKKVTVEARQGYMLFLNDKQEPPYFRRGVLKIYRNK